MAIKAGTTTLQSVTVNGTVITKIYAQNAGSGPRVLVFQGGIAMALWFGANWKMNKIKSEIDSFFETFGTSLVLDNTKKVIIFPPACYLDYVNSKITAAGLTSMVSIGIQNISPLAVDTGSYTGQISAKMAADCGCSYVLVGHSEARTYLEITDSIAVIQAKKAREFGMKVVLCVGEPLEIREAETQETYVANQIDTVLSDLTASDYTNGNLIIAYEPIWAIGTGKTISTTQIADMISYIKTYLRNHYSQEVAQTLPIVFAGNIKTGNAAEILSQPSIGGALIGGASTNAATFAQIINNEES